MIIKKYDCQTDPGTDRQTLNKVIPICRCAKHKRKKKNATTYDGVNEYIVLSKHIYFINISFLYLLPSCLKILSHYCLFIAVSGDSLRSSTICATSEQNVSINYNVHNLYGMLETEASYA